MNVAVIGAGIAGLAVAAHLARSAIDFTIYEESEDFSELGAGIQLSPNGTRLLRRLGLALDDVAVRPASIDLLRWDSGELIARTELGDACTAMFGSPYLILRRADLHRALLSLVADAVRPGRRCVGIDVGDVGVGVGIGVDVGVGVGVEEGDGGATALFADGSRVDADLIVGADGINSAVRQAVADEPPRPAHLQVYRGLCPASCWPSSPRVEIWLGPGQHCVTYPVPGAVSFVAGVAAGAGLLSAYQGWHPRLRELLGAATWLTPWSLREGAPLTRWTRGRTVLIGDAAHAMIPVGAQGATQAVEDAAALTRALLPAADRRCGGLGAALRRWESVRVARMAQVGAAVRRHAREHHLPDGPEQRQRDASLTDRQRLSAQAWLYGYDAEQAVAA